MTKCLLISPRFSEYTYWSLREVCGLIGARHPSPPLGLLTVAALLPSDWEIRLLDLNVRDMDVGLVDWADLVMIGAMVVQRWEACALIRLAHGRGKPVVVGGPDPTSVPDAYTEADFRVLDEGEMTVPAFLADVRAGARHGTYRSADKPDVTRSPLPRFDLLELDRYLWVGVQFSRGCPFNCEFCDIIELYGRKPRTKTAGQVLRELECLYGMGYRGPIEFVDDNFIGNRREVTAFLPELLTWSRERGFPFYFSTEATINLADDAELLALMEAVDFRFVFVGIETPDERVLAMTQKKQNLRHPVAESVRRLNERGLVVIAGFILGFDGEGPAAARGIVECVDAAAIAMAMPSLLTALPNTQLTRRLAREGRLLQEYWDHRPETRTDQMTGGLNFVTSRPRREILEDYAWVVRQLYSPKAFFDRTLRSITWLRRRRPPGGFTRRRLREHLAFPKLIWRLGCDRETAWYFWRNLSRMLLTAPTKVEAICQLMSHFLHYRMQTRHVLQVIEAELAARAPEETAPSIRAARRTSTRRAAAHCEDPSADALGPTAESCSTIVAKTPRAASGVKWNRS
jgi:radical SAM superfamily enzyme YgiQ (UPF0313 family)